MTFRELLIADVGRFCKLDERQLAALEEHYVLLQKWNRVINLTAVRGLADSVRRHYSESLFLTSVLPAGPMVVVDAGSGGGFPGVPLAVVREDARVVLVEARARKAAFLKEATRGFHNVSVFAGRMETYTEEFDWLVSRAVAWADLRCAVGKARRGVALLVSGGDEPCRRGTGRTWERSASIGSINNHEAAASQDNTAPSRACSEECFEWISSPLPWDSRRIVRVGRVSRGTPV